MAAVLLIGAVILAVVGLANIRGESKKYDIVTTNFVYFDIARAITGDAERVRMLMPTGTEAHELEPTPEDIVSIKNAKLFIYNGGEDEAWVEELLGDVPREQVLKMMGLTEIVNDDEHIWTSPVKMVALAEGVRDKLAAIFPDEATKFTENSAKYTARAWELDREIREVVSSSPRETLVFGDRFPFLYFIQEYELKYAAAFDGCDEHTEVNAKTLAELIEKAREANVKVILKDGLSSNKIAQTIADEVSGVVREFSAAHNVSKEDFEAGVTYLDILEKNIGVLREALK